MLNSLEWERLQTLPENYTGLAELSEAKRKNAIGNGWTVDVIAHILTKLNNGNIFGKKNRIDFGKNQVCFNFSK
jgi:hypothetical protein